MMSLKKVDLYKKRFNESNFRKKTMPKILSVLFAVIFWLYVMDQVNPEMVRTIPNLSVQILNQESIQNGGFVVLDQEIPTVSVKIKGRRKAVMDIKAEDIILTSEIKAFHKGINYFPISKAIFADNVTIEGLSENRIQMNIDRMMERVEAITIKTVGSLPQDQSLGEVKLTPEKVVVRGPETAVKLVAAVVGEVDLAKVQNNIITNIELKALDQNGQLVETVTLSKRSVTASIGLLKENRAEIEASILGSVPKGYQIMNIEVLPATLSLKGKADNYVELSTIKTAGIDVSDMTSNQEISVPLDITNGNEYVDLPKTVTVRLTIEKIEEKELTFNASDIKWLNTPGGFKVNLADPNRTLTVRVKAAQSILDQISTEDILLNGDSGEIKEGENKIKIDSSCKLDVESITVIPAAIDVVGVKN